MVNDMDMRQLEHLKKGLKSGMKKDDAIRYSRKKMEEEGHQLIADKKGYKSWNKKGKAKGKSTTSIARRANLSFGGK